MLSRPRAIGLVLSLGLSQVAAFASSFYLMGVMADPVAASLGIGPSLVFALFSGAMLIAAALTPATGRLMHRLGAKRVFLTCLLLLGASLALLATATSVVGLGLALAVMGAGMSAGLYAGPNALSVEVFEDAARRAITVTSLIGGFGSTCAWMLTPRLQAALGWRGACWVWTAVLVCAVVPLVTGLAPAPRSKEPAAAIRPIIAWDRPMLQLAGLFCGTWFIAAGVGAHLPRLLATLGLPPAEAAATAGLLGLAAVSARLVELILLRRSHPLLTARLASLGAVAGALAVARFGVAAAPVLVVAQGLANGLLSVANGVLPLALWGKEGYAARAALLNTPAKFAQTGAPLVLALALDHGAGAALTLTGCISLAMCAATFGVDRGRPGGIGEAGI